MSPRGQGTRAPLSCASQAESPLRAFYLQLGESNQVVSCFGYQGLTDTTKSIHPSTHTHPNPASERPRGRALSYQPFPGRADGTHDVEENPLGDRKAPHAGAASGWRRLGVLGPCPSGYICMWDSVQPLPGLLAKGFS